MQRSLRPRAVTFDCWATLLVEVDGGAGRAGRFARFAERVGIEPTAAEAALSSAWRKHQIEWHHRRAFTAPDMARHALTALGLPPEDPLFSDSVRILEEEVLRHDVRALPGAGEALERLAEAGVRRALICDTGYAPGRVVRELLSRVGLLPWLEVCVFSDEVGVPKPHPRAFEAALAPLGVAPGEAIHVGDLRRSDVAGARAFGMGQVRFAAHHDDVEAGPGPAAGIIDCNTAGCVPACARPEADTVVRSYGELLELLELLELRTVAP